MIKANVSINLQLFAQRFPQNCRHKRNVILFIPNTSHLANYHVASLISLDSIIDQICGSFFLRLSYHFFFWKKTPSGLWSFIYVQKLQFCLNNHPVSGIWRFRIREFFFIWNKEEMDWDFENRPVWRGIRIVECPD